MNLNQIDPNDPALAGHMVTFSGQIVNLMNPDPATIKLIDIAHGLANNNRWNGHTRKAYSVAEHSLRVSNLCPEHLKLTGLFHDCEEAYWSDIIQPIKMLLHVHYPELIARMKQLRRIIFDKYNIADNSGYKPYDTAELKWDFKHLILKSDLYFIPMDASDAKAEWLYRAENLIKVQNNVAYVE